LEHVHRLLLDAETRERARDRRDVEMIAHLPEGTRAVVARVYLRAMGVEPPGGEDDSPPPGQYL
jgi:hypothetical protein